MEKYNIRDLLFEELIELTLEAEDFEDAIKKSVRMHIGRDMLRKGLRMQLSKEKSCTRQHYPRRYSRLQSLIPWKGIRLRNRQSSLQS